ncbi:hypothetical protein LCGC14_1525600 [marine sediment metagenome]|uniref:Uncharacterized protein n=1 Tax=marine sediment metagenome TaxID=412755 RepID=A0A0F9LYB8_9ZZZZ
MARKEAFMGRDGAETKDQNMISVMVKRTVNKKGPERGTLEPLSRDEKMLCALRKALANKSGLEETLGARYYIAGDGLYVTGRGGGAHARGQAGSYTATGRFKLGIVVKDRAAFRIAKFSITYKDVEDDRGIADVDYVDPTIIDLLPKNASLIPV